jgi:hypothetical protein
MTIDPRWSFYLSLSLAVCGFLGGAGAQFTDLGLASSTVKAILALITLVLGIGNAVNAVLAAIPSKDSKTGFYLAPKPDQPPK